MTIFAPESILSGFSFRFWRSRMVCWRRISIGMWIQFFCWAWRVISRVDGLGRFRFGFTTCFLGWNLWSNNWFIFRQFFWSGRWGRVSSFESSNFVLEVIQYYMHLPLLLLFLIIISFLFPFPIFVGRCVPVKIASSKFEEDVYLLLENFVFSFHDCIIVIMYYDFWFILRFVPLDPWWVFKPDCSPLGCIINWHVVV